MAWWWRFGGAEFRLRKWEPLIVSFLAAYGPSHVNRMSLDMKDHTSGRHDFMFAMSERQKFRVLDRMVGDGTLRVKNDPIYGRVYSLSAKPSQLLQVEG